ncbi:MAG: hypothetical protein ACI4PE_03370 [Bacilli bacterium]
MKIMKNMNVKDMLKAGVSAKDLRNKLEQEIEKATAAIKEEAEDKKVGLMRKRLVDAAIDYMQAMDWLEEGLNEEDRQDLVEVLKDLEDELGTYVDIIKLLIRKETNKNKKKDNGSTAEDIINKFLGTL